MRTRISYPRLSVAIRVQFDANPNSYAETSIHTYAPPTAHINTAHLGHSVVNCPRSLPRVSPQAQREINLHILLTSSEQPLHIASVSYLHQSILHHSIEED